MLVEWSRVIQKSAESLKSFECEPNLHPEQAKLGLHMVHILARSLDTKQL